MKLRLDDREFDSLHELIDAYIEQHAHTKGEVDALKLARVEKSLARYDVPTMAKARQSLVRQVDKFREAMSRVDPDMRERLALVMTKELDMLLFVFTTVAADSIVKPLVREAGRNSDTQAFEEAMRMYEELCGVPSPQ